MALHTWYAGAHGTRATISRLNGAATGSPKVVGQRPTSRIFHPAIGSVFVSHCDLTKTREVGPRRQPWGNGFDKGRPHADAWTGSAQPSGGDERLRAGRHGVCPDGKCAARLPARAIAAQHAPATSPLRHARGRM